jgi:putative peptidoglycan lipid II flippase
MRFLNGEIANVHSAALILGAAGLFSRLLGVLRDRLLAGHFGAGRELDIYYTAFQIPDMVSLVLVLGAGSAAILPIFQDALARDRREAHRLISHLVTLFLAVAVGVAFIFFLATPLLIRFIAPGFSPDERHLASVLTQIMLVSPILLGLSGIFSAVLQSFQRFLAFALAPVLYNIGIIAGIIFFVPLWGFKGLALGVIAGAFLHLLIQLRPVIALGFTPRVAPHLFKDTLNQFFSGPVFQVFKLSFPRFLSLSVTQITLIILVALGSTLAAGSIAVFKLANNLFYVPIGIFGVSYAVALFPKLSNAYIKKDAKLFFEEIFLGLKSILFWIMPSAVLFIVLRAHIVRVALGAGAFSWEDTRLSAAILGILAIAMFAEGIASLLIKGFYALENTWRPLFINIASAFVSVGAAFFFSKALSEHAAFSIILTAIFRVSDLPNPEVLGLALGFSLGTIINVLVLYGSLQRLAERKFEVCEHFPFLTIVKIVVAALLGGAVAYGVRVSFSETLPLITFSRVLIQGLLAGSAGFVAYFLVMLVLRSEEMYSITRSLRRVFFKLKVLPPHWDGEEIQRV